MMGSWMMVVRNLIKTSLDNYVLPGTAMGTEILWLYAIHWKRDLAVLLSAYYYSLLSRAALLQFERILSSRQGTPAETAEYDQELSRL